MEITTFSDAAEYAARVLPRLVADEARFNMALTVIDSLRTGRLTPTAIPLLAVVSDGPDEFAVLHTPPHGLLLTGLPGGAAGPLVDAVLARGYTPPLVIGPPEDVDLVVDEWRLRTGAGVDRVRRQGIYAVRALTPPAPVHGAARVATDADGDLVFAWFTAFHDEVGLGAAIRREMTAARIAAGDIVLWSVDGVPVSTAGVAGRTPRGARVGPVFTPEQYRGRGYAGAATAAVTRRCFDQGAERCFLYTDLDNPTSNALYQRLGYEWVTESREVTFTSASA